MSLKNPKNLLIIGAVVVALLAGTVLLANYANILPGSSDADSQAKTCQAAGGTSWPAAKAVFAENAEVCSAKKSAPGCCPKANPSGCTKPCCAGEAAPGCCPKASPPATTGSCGGQTSTAAE